jgi:hypothetical protein
MPFQKQKDFHFTSVRLKLVTGGERAGKSLATAMEMLTWIAQRPNGRFWIVGPDYEQARAEFIYIQDGLQKIGLADTNSISTPKNGAWMMKTILGGIVETKTSADVARLASIAPDGVAMVEAAQHEEEAWLRLRGRVSEKRGPLILSGTLERSQEWYAELWRRWQGLNEDDARSFSIPTWDNLAAFPGGREDPEIKRLEATFPPEIFMERFGAVPIKPSDLVFPEFEYSRHVSEEAEHEPGAPVQLWIDPGYSHAYAVLAVEVRENKVYHFDEVYQHGMTAEQIIAICKDRPWWPDVRVLVMDYAAKQHPSAESQEEIWRRLTGLPAILNRVRIVDGILRHRTFLIDPATKEPRLFHHPRCSGTLAEYGQYRYPRDASGRVVSEVPIDIHNDAMKAIAYGLVANFGFVDAGLKPAKVSIYFRRH